MFAEAAYFTRKPDWVAGLVRVGSLDFWRGVNPHLNITHHPFTRPIQSYPVGEPDLEQALEQICVEGYLHIPPAISTEICQALALGVTRIIEVGLHPIYLSLYDEYWQVLRNLSAVMEPVLGKDYLALGDFWCWCISPETAPSGWGPHRDYQFKANTTRGDGRPMLVTAWLPFTDTDPLNGCMYLIPQNRDPFIPNQLEKTGFRNPQDIRALPARAGSIMAWNQYIQHWGGHSSKWAKCPRIATGVYLQSADVDPYVNKPVRFDRELSFEHRLGFTASNILNYHMYHNYPQPVLRMCFEQIQALPNFVPLVPPALRTLMADYLDELEDVRECPPADPVRE
ncbi:MAG: phytanoyl-CoA dioxygenase family protein [Candidatus Eremiobacteraeota bacterium]|nr:phytanoyl-CoA dioxygenase family protein [Candidatus Eremiobacteraeota bacterium]MCW5868979.1 phytanoyl-CoA dioxygenase family protein [Candidatus Eremiobacteraeota bacterium]